MKITVTAATIALLSSLTLAQVPGLGQFPCAQTCIQNLLASPICNPDQSALPNANCICKSRPLINDVSCCISQNCPPSEQTKALNFARGICGSIQGNVIPASAGCSASASSSAAATSAASSSASASMAASMSAAASQSQTAAMSSAAAGGATTVAAGTEGTASSASSPAPAGDGAGMVKISGGVVGAAVLGVAGVVGGMAVL